MNESFKSLNQISGLILSAGEGSRVGGNKALLRFGGRTFMERVSNAVRESAICSEIVVVTGHDHDRVSDEALRLQLKSVFNPHSKQGLMTSLQAGLQALTPDTDAVLIALVDQPLITGDFIAEFVHAFETANHQGGGRYTLGRPYYHGRPGHPSLILREHFASILSRTPNDEGANYLFQQFGDRVFKFETENRSVATDIDTADDLRGLLHAP